MSISAALNQKEKAACTQECTLKVHAMFGLVGLNDLSGTRDQNMGLGRVFTRHIEYSSQLNTLGAGALARTLKVRYSVYPEGTRIQTFRKSNPFMPSDRVLSDKSGFSLAAKYARSVWWDFSSDASRQRLAISRFLSSDAAFISAIVLQTQLTSQTSYMRLT